MCWKWPLVGIGLSGLGAACFSISLMLGAPARSATAQAAGADSCSALLGRTVGGAIIEGARYIPKGDATISPQVKAASEICRVSARAHPVAGSDIEIRVWLPANWNGKMLGVGGAGLNGGFVAEWFIAVTPMNEGYAVFSTDAGHDSAEDGKWAFGQPEKIKDYGYRANHVGAIAAKAIIARYYGRPAKRSYFHGCSNGGRDALIQAQRYPQDWDGIIAGAPANYYAALMATFARDAQVARAVPNLDSMRRKLALVHDDVLKKCDAADGAKDRLISNPTTCRFDPAVLQCKSRTGPSCLSRPEIAALRALYDGTRTGDGKLIMPGYSPGSELGWSQWFSKPADQVPDIVLQVFRYMVYNDPTWDLSRFQLDRDYPILKSRIAPIIDATDADLRPFASHGGKLLMYQGWEDPAVPPRSTIRYFEAAHRALGGQADHIRLFMVPGLGHCFGGSGPNVINLIDALDSWVESGKPPERLIATKYESFGAALTGQPTKLLQTRPVCAWPKGPHYKGSGPVDQEASFVCR